MIGWTATCRSRTQKTAASNTRGQLESMRTRKSRSVSTCIVISDTHCGCKLAICGKDPIPLDEGGNYTPSKYQRVLWNWWEEFWGEWVPRWVKDEPFCVVHNGDAVDGNHHNTTSQISHNLGDQNSIALRVLQPVVAACDGRYYHIRGTEAHVGQSGVNEESLAKQLGAIPNEDGQHARYDLWLEVGDRLIHFLHHIGTTGSSHHEASAVNGELSAEFVEAARWGQRPPDVIVRSHRHRAIEVRLPTHFGYATALVTPAWQLKTSFAWKVPGARLAPPQIGGSLIRRGDRALFTDSRVWHIERSPTEKPR